MIRELLLKLTNIKFVYAQTNLLLLLVGLLLILLLLYSIWRTRSVIRHKCLLLIRISCITLLLLAWCSPYLSLPDKSSQTYLLVDLSKSMDADVAQKLIKQTNTVLKNNLEVYGFADTLHKVGYLPTNYSAWQSALPVANSETTDLAQALLELEQQVPGRKNILLISDGHETKGSALNAVKLLSPTTKIFPLLPKIEPTITSQFKPILLNVPQSIPIGNKAVIEVSIQNTTSEKQLGNLQLFVDEKLHESKNIELAPHTNSLVTFETDQIKEGINTIRAKLVPKNNYYPAAELLAYISGQMRDRVLVLSGTVEDQSQLIEVLKEQAYQSDHYISSELPTDLLNTITNYRAVILNNINHTSLPEELPLNLKEYVATGGGLLMLGGNNSFGLGGYIGTPIEDLLPVKMLPPQQEQRRLNNAVVLVLDQSGSMKEQSRLEHAKASAQAVVNNLKDDDYIGIIGFSSTPFEIFPLNQLGANRRKALERIELMFAGDTTNLIKALELGRGRLESARAGRKHMIILTDGKLPDGIARRPYYLQTVDQMRRSGMTVSTFLIGGEYDLILKEMAEVGGGAFYRTSALTNLPRLFLEDIKISTGDRTQREGQLYDVRSGSSGILSTSLRSFPAVLGYVQTQARATAQLELTAYANRNADPLLASWQYEKGRVIAYTADVSGRWSKLWVSWPQFAKFWSSIIDSLMDRSLSSSAPTFEFNSYLQGGALQIETSVFSEHSAADLQLEVKKPDNSKLILDLNSVVKGHYQSTLTDPVAGDYELQLSYNDTRLTPIRVNISSSEIGERKGLGYNKSLLSELALQTGASVNPVLTEFETKSNSLTLKKPIDYYFIIMALCLLIIEVALREIKHFKLLTA